MQDDTLAWLLDPAFPTVRRMAATRLGSRTVAEAPTSDEPWIAALLRGPGGTDRTHPYQKWTGVHWRLIALAELGADSHEPDVGGVLDDGFGQVAAWLGAAPRLRASRAIDGRVRQCASMDGYAAWAAIRLGRAPDPRVADIVTRLLDWQWPQGGWNCDTRAGVVHPSFNETLGPLRALAAFATAGPPGALRDRAEVGAARAAEFLLVHRIDRSHRTGAIAHPTLPRLRWPPYWHYDRLGGLRALREAGVLDDPRAAQALDDLAAAATPDGRWVAAGRYWQPPGPRGTGREVVDWTSGGEDRMLTLLALEVLAARRAP